MLPKKKTLKATKLRSSMNFRMIQAVIKCFERSTVERIEENSNVSRCLVTRCKYGHCEMRNKKLINSISHYSESDSVSSRVFYSAVSTAPPFLLPRSRRLGGLCSASGLFFFLVLSVTWPRPPLGQMLVRTFNHETCNV